MSKIAKSTQKQNMGGKGGKRYHKRKFYKPKQEHPNPYQNDIGRSSKDSLSIAKLLTKLLGDIANGKPLMEVAKQKPVVAAFVLITLILGIVYLFSLTLTIIAGASKGALTLGLFCWLNK